MAQQQNIVQSRRALIFGAGPTGLACAWHLRKLKKHASVVLYDQASLCGGTWASRDLHNVRHSPQVIGANYPAFYALVDDMNLRCELEAELRHHNPPFWEALRGARFRVLLELALWWLLWLLGLIRGDNYVGDVVSNTAASDSWLAHVCLLLDGVSPKKLTIEALFAGAHELGRYTLSTLANPNAFFAAWLAKTGAQFVPNVSLRAIGPNYVVIHDNTNARSEHVLIDANDTDVFLCLDPLAYANVVHVTSGIPYMGQAIFAHCYRGIGFALEWHNLPLNLIRAMQRYLGSVYDFAPHHNFVWMASIKNGSTLRVDGTIIGSLQNDYFSRVDWQQMTALVEHVATEKFIDFWAHGLFARELRHEFDGPEVMAIDPMLSLDGENACGTALPARLNSADEAQRLVFLDAVSRKLAPNFHLMGAAFSSVQSTLPYHTLESSVESVARHFAPKFA